MRLSARASGSSCGAGVVYPLEAPPTQPAMPARTQYRPICHAYQQLLAQVCLAEIVQIKRVLPLVDQPCAATVEKRTCGFPNSRWRLKSFQQSAATASRAKIYFVSARRLAAAVRAARHYSRLTLKDEALQEREQRRILEVLPMQHGVDGTCHSSFVITFCCLRFMTLKIRSALLHGLFLSDWRW